MLSTDAKLYGPSFMTALLLVLASKVIYWGGTRFHSGVVQLIGMLPLLPGYMAASIIALFANDVHDSKMYESVAIPLSLLTWSLIALKVLRFRQRASRLSAW